MAVYGMKTPILDFNDATHEGLVIIDNEWSKVPVLLRVNAVREWIYQLELLHEEVLEDMQREITLMEKHIHKGTDNDN